MDFSTPAMNGITAEALRRLRKQRSTIDSMATLYLDGFRLTVEIRRFTPTEAQHILDNSNKINRTMGRALVDKYARMMADGMWELNGETIIFDESGNLVTGQHRLAACVKSNTPFYTLVVTDVSKDAFKTCDRGKAKTNGQILQLAGEVNTNTLAGAINLISAYRSGSISFTSTFRTSRLEPSEMEEFIEANPSIRQSILVGKNCHMIVNPAMSAAAHFIFSEINANLADAFFEALQTGQNLSAGNPVYSLRERLLTSGKSGTRMISEFKLALTIKAWNYYRTNTPLKCLRITTTGESAESFPRAI